MTKSPSNLSLTDLVLFEHWLKDRGLSDGSIYSYMSGVKKFLLTNPDIENIEDYNQFILEHAIKKRSCYYYDALKLFIKWKIDDTARKNSMTRLLLKPKLQDPKRHVHFLDDETREQVIKLIKDYKHRIIARIQNATGTRAGDILRLRRGSISYEPYDGGVLVMRIDFHGKGGKRFVKWIFDTNIQNQIELFIKTNLLDGDYYFLEKDKSFKTSNENVIIRTNYHRYWMDLKQALSTAGVDYKDWSTHDFRRMFARKVWDKTHDPVVLKEALNHQQFETTVRYLRGTGLQSKDLYWELEQDRRNK